MQTLSNAMNSVVCSTGQNIRKLVKDGFVIRKPHKIHSRFRARKFAEAKAKGRHTGYGRFLETFLHRRILSI